ncbi:MAG: hypothetical protein P8K79_11610 [Mariniblastus sp.]|nr:hypothetical protein [Mariniblastus sp.]
MAFHVPYSQRQKNSPVYIGFEAPRAHPRKRSNWWGLGGLLLSIAGLFTCGFFSPIAFLISLIGLGRGPRRAAVAGTVISLAGMAIAASLVFGSVSNQMQRREMAQQAIQAKEISHQVNQGEKLLASAVSELEGFRDEHNGSLPEAIDGNMLVIKYMDPWDQELRYDEGIDRALVRSAGPDMRFDTDDDLTRQIKGDTDYEPLLPIDR